MNKSLALLVTGLVLLPTVILSACGGDAAAVLVGSTPLVDFGEVIPGESSQATLRIDNVGTDVAEVPSPVISGDDAGLFALVTGEWPLSIDAGGSIEIALSFSPAEAGTFTAAIELSSSSDALSGGGWVRGLQ